MIEVPCLLAFDLNIEAVTKTLLEKAVKDFPYRSWVVTATYWSDGDYQVQAESSMNNQKQIYRYKKGEKNYHKMLTDMPQFPLCSQVYSDEEFPIRTALSIANEKLGSAGSKANLTKNRE